MNLPKTVEVKVTRAELRKRKIILTLEPDLLTGEEFAVSPFYDEGSKNNMLQDVNISVRIVEKKGKINASAEYYGSHYTTGHTQINSLNSCYISKKDRAIAYILKTEYQYIEDDSRMNKLLSNWSSDPDFKAELVSLINERKDKHRKEELKLAMEQYDEARKNLEKAMFGSDYNKKIS